jgi:uncharacterized protein (DUF2147 family)
MTEFFGFSSRRFALTHLRLLQMLLSVLFLSLSPAALLAADPQDAILGSWLTDDGASRVEVSKAPAADGSMVYTGKLTWLKQPAPNGSPALGTTILADFKATATGWTGGTVYAPRRGKSFPAELSVAADGRLQLNIKAGVGSRTDYWTR